MSGSPQTATLVASTVKTFTLDKDYSEVEVSIVENPAVVWWRTDGQAPVAMADGCQVLPAVLSFATARPGTSGPTVVKVLSTGTPTVSVRGVLT